MKFAKFKFIAAALALSLATTFTFTGCKSLMRVSAGSDIVIYEKGTLATTLKMPIAKVQRAVRDTLKDDFKFNINSQEDAIGGYYTAVTSLEEKVRVRLERSSDQTTMIDIRVGLLGNESLSRSILEAINKHLD
jgi:hypothetical protein